MKYDIVIIQFGEIWLKGRNRGSFVKRLYSNIQESLKKEKYEKLENARDRFVIHLNKKSDIDSICDALSHVFGISWFAPAFFTENKISKIVSSCSKLFGKKDKVRIIAHRSYKISEFTSQELVQSFIKNQKKIPYTLDLEAENEIHIQVLQTRTLIYCKKMQGAGGLPVGSSGRCVVLLSGGIDSPVASFYAMKRGLAPVYVHVHAFPDDKKVRISKMKQIAETLSKYHEAKVYYIPSYIFQAATLNTPKEYELVLFKRFLYKLAEKVAAKEKAEVIVTGESLGQVASQTVKNLIATESDTEALVMRPLIGFDKQEIINIAKKLDTYELSIKKYPDVCSIRAKNPATGADSRRVDELYAKCKLDSVIVKSLGKASVVDY